MKSDEFIHRIKRMISSDIDFSIKWKTRTSAEISWFDPVIVDQEDGKTLTGIAGHIGTALLLSSLILPFIFWSFWPLILLPIAAIYGFVAASFQGLSKKIISINADYVVFNDRNIPSADISRIAVSTYEEWNDLTQKQKKGEESLPYKRTIDIWVDDIDRIIVSKNNFTQLTNMKIQRTIQETLEIVKKEAVKEVKKEEHGTSDDFGMPDY